ncbi:MAG: exonuclease SbcCD subunit D [Acidimicrobiales bacterium]|nr:exonuclease SbcCD subunit D [Acidimicrobiales bacterium]
MKILHTSDWHLGRSFGTYGLLPDQEAFLQWLITTAEQNDVELVAIAGDIYDRSNPPAEAIRAFNSVVVSLNAAGIEVAAIAGNHDSAERVAIYSAFTQARGLLLRGGYPTAQATSDSGPVGRQRHDLVAIRDFSDGPLAIAAIPFLDPRLIPTDFTLLDPDDGPFTHNQVVTACAKAAAAEVPEGMRSLAMAHGFVAGGKGSDSEKSLIATVGGTDHIGASCFEPFSYTALGHLHRPQTVRKTETIRYSGTPLPYSFSETGPKSVVLIDMDAKGECSVSLIEVPCGKGVRTIRASFAEVSGMSADAEHLVRVELTDHAPIREAKRRLLPLFPHLVELSLVNLNPPMSPHHRQGQGAPSLAQQVQDFLEVATGAEAAIDDFDLITEAFGEVGLETHDASLVREAISERTHNGSTGTEESGTEAA